MSHQLIDTHSTFGRDMDGRFVHHRQELSTEFLDTLKSERHAKAHMRAGELNRVASVPTFLWELWMRQGRDPYNATARQIVSWLEADSLQAFITTPKSV